MAPNCYISLRKVTESWKDVWPEAYEIVRCIDISVTARTALSNFVKSRITQRSANDCASIFQRRDLNAEKSYWSWQQERKWQQHNRWQQSHPTRELHIYKASIQCNENQKSNSTAPVAIVKSHFNGRARSSGLESVASSDSSGICPSCPACSWIWASISLTLPDNSQTWCQGI